VIETLMTAVTDYGGAALAVILAINCLGVPFPTSLIMLAAGALAADGELDATVSFAGAAGGAFLGDQIGYWIGRLGGPPLAAAIARRFGVGAAIARAEAFGRRWGAVGVFLTRWLFSPLGPYVNLVAATGGMGWPAFALWSGLGESLWVVLYIGLGYAFADEVQALADLLGNAVWLVIAVAVAAGLGWKLFGPARRRAVS
jgi:membrane protein DedA with SNARE-associated domain